MRAILGEARSGVAGPAVLVLGAFALLSLGVLSMPLRIVAPLVLLAVVGTMSFSAVLPWGLLLKAILVLIMFIPIRRYTLPVRLGISLEPYRILVAVVLFGWLGSLLVDRRVRARRSGFELPLLGYLAAILISVAANIGAIGSAGLGSEVAKQISFFVSFVLLVYLITSVVRGRGSVDALLKVLVVTGSAVAVSAAIERRSGYNVFNHLDSVIPFLRPDALLGGVSRDGGNRALGSAQHPIAMGAVFVMLIPLALYLARTRSGRLWGALAVTLCVGSVATLSRTTVLMLAVVAVVYLVLRPRETRRLWPALLPALVIIHFAVPGTLGPLKNSFFPQGGLIADQKTSQGSVGQGRLADIGPALREFSQTPLYGEGFGSRVIEFDANGVPVGGAQILDDQWLDTLLETGTLGVAALLLLLVTAIKRMGGAARRDYSERGWALASLTASIGAFGVGMLTFDAFAFIQVTLLFFVLLALGAVLLKAEAEVAVGSESRSRRAAATRSALSF